jgi:hypothetical protein
MLHPINEFVFINCTLIKLGKNNLFFNILDFISRTYSPYLTEISYHLINYLPIPQPTTGPGNVTSLSLTFFWWY